MSFRYLHYALFVVAWWALSPRSMKLLGSNPGTKVLPPAPSHSQIGARLMRDFKLTIGGNVRVNGWLSLRVCPVIGGLSRVYPASHSAVIGSSLIPVLAQFFYLKAFNMISNFPTLIVNPVSTHLLVSYCQCFLCENRPSTLRKSVWQWLTVWLCQAEL